MNKQIFAIMMAAILSAPAASFAVQFVPGMLTRGNLQHTLLVTPDLFKGSKEISNVQITFSQLDLATAQVQITDYPLWDGTKTVPTSGSAKILLMRKWDVWWVMRIEYKQALYTYQFGAEPVLPMRRISPAALLANGATAPLTTKTLWQALRNGPLASSEKITQIRLQYLNDDVATATVQVTGYQEVDIQTGKRLKVNGKAQVTMVRGGNGKWAFVHFHFRNKNKSYPVGSYVAATR